MNLKLSPFFSDGMVLQRGADIKISGSCLPLESVQISFFGTTFTAKACDNGKWVCSVGRYTENSTPAEMKISSCGEEIIICNILIGDVWLCSGQSNMELMLDRACHNYPDEMSVTNPFIRQCKVPQVYNFEGAQSEITSCGWESFSPQTASNFTAAGYFFAKKLHERYKVPIGLFACAVGGTPVAAWMSADMLKNFPEELAKAEKCKNNDYIKNTLSHYDDYVQDYHNRLDQADKGLKQNWESTEYDDSDWEEISLFKSLDRSGSYWYRKTVQIPQEMQGKEATIFLGTAVDMDEVFINAQKIGTTFYRYPPREYKFTLPQSEKLTIAVRLFCYNGFGGFTAGKNCFIATETRTFDIGIGAWKRRVGTEFENQKPQTFFQYCPTGLFNGMISPLVSANYVLKGVIWYQGESDTAVPERYAEKLAAMINGWRRLFEHANSAHGEMPFLLTQLAYFHDTLGTDWDLLREQQKKCLELPGTGLAAAYDLGEHNDLHPQNKRDIGERLARLAMRIAYGEKLKPNLFEMYNC
ncbi:MAG: sialate O-acetylesterase [Oscillospiraceae bacterium]|nr:sialate O-acetylesterase [Oscillospiraceae bacterium]